MCEAHAFILRNGKEEKILENVDLVEFEDNEIKLTSIFGEQKTLKARLKLYNNSEGKIVFEPEKSMFLYFYSRGFIFNILNCYKRLKNYTFFY